jgi:hypothetical protein
LHPVAATQLFVVQDFPSSQVVVEPPPVHWPDTHVRAAVQVRPEHEEASQVVPLE